MSKLAVVAIGGNALILDGQRGTIQEQQENALQTARQIAKMVERGWRVVITHGNGPQVGFILMRSDRSADVLPRLPLDICVADSQGGIGYIIGSALHTAMGELELNTSVATILTRSVVDADDPAFRHPTKPVGPFMTQEEAEKYRDEDGWDIVEDSGRGYRRVVASPEPIRILEVDAIRLLADGGQLVVAGGGGGIPIRETDEGTFEGVEAVIDKDLASSLLALELNADLLLVSTGVPRVAINFRKPDQRDVEEMTVEEARRYMVEGQFPAGSMGPKIEAAVRFLQGHPGGKVLITSPESMTAALDGETGTWMTA